MIDTILTSYRLKEHERSGWLLRGVEMPESVADHSWGTAFLCMIYAAEAGVDQDRSVRMAVVHDIAEAITGDVATRVAEMDDPDVQHKKSAREQVAVQELFGDAQHEAVESVRELWAEYENRSSTAALFVRDMNLIDMCLQALVYERDGRYDHTALNRHFPDFAGMDEFFATTRPRLGTRIGRELFEEVIARYGRLDRVAERGGPGA